MAPGPTPPMPGSLAAALRDETRRHEVAVDAVAEAEAAVKARPGLAGLSAQLGLEAIHRLRPGFLQRHVHALLPDMAHAVDPHWQLGTAIGDGHSHLVANAHEITLDLLAVSDAYVAAASDSKAIAVYNQLRPRAPERIAAQMHRIAIFIERHTPPPSS